jgi:hypothetical protein
MPEQMFWAAIVRLNRLILGQLGLTEDASPCTMLDKTKRPLGATERMFSGQIFPDAINSVRVDKTQYISKVGCSQQALLEVPPKYYQHG